MELFRSDVYEEEILDRIVIPQFMSIHLESNDVVRSSVANFLVEMCIMCESKRCLEMLDILDKVG